MFFTLHKNRKGLNSSFQATEHYRLVNLIIHFTFLRDTKIRGEKLEFGPTTVL